MKMDKNNPWKILEQLADPSISLERKAALETKLKDYPVMLDRLETFRVLQAWPELDAVDRPFVNVRQVMDKIDRMDAMDTVDLEIKRAFPWVAATALAAAVILALVNFEMMGESSDNTLEALFGLTVPTIEETLYADL
jgi:hypothetical protein